MYDDKPLCMQLTNVTTGKSFSEALILASTNPQYDKRLFYREGPIKNAIELKPF